MNTIIEGNRKIEKKGNITLAGKKVKVMKYYIAYESTWMYAGTYYVPMKIADKDLVKTVSDMKFEEDLKADYEKERREI